MLCLPSGKHTSSFYPVLFDSTSENSRNLTRAVNSEANMRGSIPQALLMDASTKSASAMPEVGTSLFQRDKPISLLKRRSRRLDRK